MYSCLICCYLYIKLEYSVCLHKESINWDGCRDSSMAPLFNIFPVLKNYYRKVQGLFLTYKNKLQLYLNNKHKFMSIKREKHYLIPWRYLLHRLCFVFSRKIMLSLSSALLSEASLSGLRLSIWTLLFPKWAWYSYNRLLLLIMTNDFQISLIISMFTS
jgi:hypothetical protein